MRSGSRALLVLAVLTHAARLAAQESKPAPDLPLGKVEPARLVPYHQTFKVIQVAQGAERQVATVDDQLVLTGDGLLRMQSLTTPRGPMVDSSVVDRLTLKPRWHRSRSPGRTMRLVFAPRHVTGDVTEGPKLDTIDLTVTDTIYDASMLDVLISALPLAEGYRARLPVFLWEAGGEIPAEISVTGSATVANEDAWAVDVGLKGRVAKYHVAKKNPRVLQIVSSPAPGVEIRFVQ